VIVNLIVSWKFL